MNGRRVKSAPPGLGLRIIRYAAAEAGGEVRVEKGRRADQAAVDAAAQCTTPLGVHSQHHPRPHGVGT
ncbi:MAG: hypothetical protein QM655_01995 [Nocardioidaceae bacterium]